MSSSRTPQVLKEWATQYLANRHRQGNVPPSAGVTSPIGDVKTASDLLEMVFGVNRQQQIRKGGGALDTVNTPVEKTYGERRYSFLSREEGIRRRAYDDATGKPITPGSAVSGNPTVGIGFNLNRPDAPKVLQSLFGYSDQDVQALKTGQKQLSPIEVRKLFDHTAQEAESIISNKFKNVPLNDNQRIALVSLAFNNPALIGPKLTQAISEGNFEGAIQEILHNSNRKKHKGIARRRYREAHLFSSGNGKKLLPDFAQYMNQYG